MTNSTDDVDWYDGYMDTPKPRKTKPLSGIYYKFRHLDRVLRDCAASTDPVHRAAAEMWAAIAKANAPAEARYKASPPAGCSEAPCTH